ncbi:MAG: gamma-glutamyltransferase [Magnetococcales bacterium]|nr:gamma-glutamyltransferase [Magnetococcales bacterium]
MVVAANPLAVKVGYEILKDGGDAVDAAIAIQMVLTLVEPQSSGIGGGAFLLYWDNQAKKLHSYDGREAAPAAAKAERFLLPGGNPRKFYQAVVGGLSVGVPGVLKMLDLAHQNHGKKSWSELFLPAIELAKKGFIVSPRLRWLLERDRYLKNSPTGKDFFYEPDGTPRKYIINLPLAQTFSKIARYGIKHFYDGELAARIVATVKGAEPAGDLSILDMQKYQAKSREPLCRPYKKRKVCSMPPPTSGGIAALQILTILEGFDLGNSAAESAEAIHLFTQAQRLAFADRNHYVADSDFVSVPVDAMLNKEYLQNRSRAIKLHRDMGKAKPGDLLEKRVESLDFSLPSTTHFSIVDRWGNGVSMTSSVENSFGSRLMVGGFLLNNQLTDFSFSPYKDGELVANRVEPGKRPRSSMTPMMVFDSDGNLQILAGSPGGSRIIGYVARVVWRLMEWGLDPQKAVAAANFGNRNGVTELEAGRELQNLKLALESIGHKVKLKTMNSGLSVITINNDGLLGGADPRREGAVMGGNLAIKGKQ